MINLLNDIIDSLRRGNLDKITSSSIKEINEYVVNLLNRSKTINSRVTKEDIECMRLIIVISNILYNNTSREILVLEDGIYDLLLEYYKLFDPNYLVGAEPIYFNNDKEEEIIEKRSVIMPILKYDDPDKNDRLYTMDVLEQRFPITKKSFIVNPIVKVSELNIQKRTTNTPHMYPKLVGTLDKVKFVLNQQARDADVFDDSNVKIFERDFLGKHLRDGIISLNQKLIMVAELKYDGVSVEAEVTNKVESARSRGDTGNDIATDLTPYLGGYRFRNTDNIETTPIGMKFEAIITKPNLDLLSRIKGKPYKNCRNAIIGILGSSDGYLYRDLITLVPLATSIEDIDRLTEINFLNKYYATGEFLRYVVLEGTYNEILFQVKKFVEEMEYIRPYIPFLYDGVVISYIDPQIIQTLGRENSVNKYQIAIKFNAMKKYTTFLGYTYTVGQNGIITPLAHYNPVEFLGGIHQKCTVNSYARFQELSLRVGDIVSLEYVNDVMPRISKADVEDNYHNLNPIEQFICNCPECGTKLEISPTGKSAICPNRYCKGRSLARMTNMLQKLELKDFSEESLKILAKDDLQSLMNLDLESPELMELGPVNAQKFLARMEVLKTQPLYDYKIIGALGFSNLAQTTWKMIFNVITLNTLITYTDSELRQILSSIKGVGKATIETILDERIVLMDDLIYINSLPNLIYTQGTGNNGMKIRVSGFRDDDMFKLLESRGCDISDGSVTKDTKYLVIVPGKAGATKLAAAQKYGIPVIELNDFMSNLDLYVPVE